MNDMAKLLGKSIVTKGGTTGTIVGRCTHHDALIIELADGKGWTSILPEDEVSSDHHKGGHLWYVDYHEIVGGLDELANVAPASSDTPSKPVEPTAPMTAKVLQMLRKKGDVTAIEAQGVLRCRSLSKRISELKRLGHAITRTLHEDHTGQRYARYVLAS